MAQNLSRHCPNVSLFVVSMVERKTVAVLTAEFGLIHLQVNCVEAEDGSGNCWNIKGYACLRAWDGKASAFVTVDRQIQLFLRHGQLARVV